MSYDILTGILIGYFTCAIGDVLFSIANFFLERAFKERAIRKAVDKEGNDRVR